MMNPNAYHCISTEARLQSYANKLFKENHVEVDFSDAVRDLTAETLTPLPCQNRLDLRTTPCFTIDCDDTKDMDDAVSLEKVDAGYRLGVHIADVAAYITLGSALDAEAIFRGTSIYLPQQTVPMLPQVLSNDLCSLNPGTDRLTVSVLIDLTENGAVTGYTISKSTIHSLLKGDYSQVNKIFKGQTNSKITAKYASVADNLFEMKNLASKLRQARIQNGANCSTDEECKIVVDGWSIEITQRKRGDAEHMIEEFMILANRLVAEYFLKNRLPVVYRAQQAKGLRAIYTTQQCHHAELSLEHYAHFTSPIRRLADLKVHQVLSAHLTGMDSETLHNIFDDQLAEAAERAKKRKNTADSITKACQKYCIKMWAEMQPQESYPARMVGRDALNRAIIEILPYHIKALGAATLSLCKGELLSCKIKTTRNNNMLTAVAIKKQRQSAPSLSII